MQVSESHQRHWRRNLRITAGLPAIWFVVTFVIACFAREPSFTFVGWPFSVSVGAQGALVVCVVIIGFYAWTMNRLGEEHGVSEGE